MRRSLLLLPLIVAACTSDPAYPPPTNEEARMAFARAIRADLIDSPPRHRAQGPTRIDRNDRPDEVAVKMGQTFNAESENTARLMAGQILQSLDRVTVGECSWGSIDSDEVQPQGRERVEGKITDGYSCTYEVFHNTPTRGRVSASGTGYFFHRDGSYDFAGVDQKTHEKVD